MNVYEMEGFLRGKCLPGDLLVGESTAEYLVRKLNEATAVKADRDALERQLSMSEAKCKGYFSDAAAALVRCDALAVENNKLCKKLTHAEGCFKAAIFEGLDEALVESAGSNLADIVSRRIVHAFPSIG